jgi:methylmalonyl-CoA mutase N-terminal domain/subunit
VQALAAVLGGTQSLHTNALDEALGLPTPASARLALRTQQVLYNESGTAATVDPLAGSYYVESLTSMIVDQAMDELPPLTTTAARWRRWPTATIRTRSATPRTRFSGRWRPASG